MYYSPFSDFIKNLHFNIYVHIPCPPRTDGRCTVVGVLQEERQTLNDGEGMKW